MTNILLDIILVLFLFGAVGQCFNERAILGIAVPDTGVTIKESQFREYQSSTNPTTVDDFTWTNIILVGLRVIGSAVLAVFTIIPLVTSFLMSVGVSFQDAVWLALLIQVPVWLVCIIGWFEWTTGRTL